MIIDGESTQVIEKTHIDSDDDDEEFESADKEEI